MVKDMIPSFTNAIWGIGVCVCVCVQDFIQDLSLGREGTPKVGLDMEGSIAQNN